MNSAASVFGLAIAVTTTFGNLAYAHDLDSSFTVVFDDCTEFVGIAAVPVENVESLVPADLTLLGDGTSALVVVRIVDCGGISVDGSPFRAGRLSQIGVSFVGDGSADIDNATIVYATDDERLRRRLRSVGMNAVRARRIVYDVNIDADGFGRLKTVVVGRRLPNHRVSGEIQAPNADPVPFVARWIEDGEAGRVDMVTTFPDLVFGVATSEFRTPARSVLADVFGGSTATFAVLDSYNAFSTATMLVSVE